MTDNKVKEYTRRISSGNRSEIIVCIFEIGEIYMTEAIDCFMTEDFIGYKTYCSKAIRCINDLLDSLNFEYELAFPLMRIYSYLNSELSLATSKNDIETVKKVKELFVKMKDAFTEVAKLDTSSPVMKNTQAVYAGLTYGRNSLNENLVEDNNRGFKV